MNVLNTKYSTDPWDILILTSYWIENWQPNELNSLHKNNSVDSEKQDDLWFIPNLKEKTNKPTTQTLQVQAPATSTDFYGTCEKTGYLRKKQNQLKKRGTITSVYLFHLLLTESLSYQAVP